MLVVLLVLLVPELLTGPRSAPPPTPAQPDQAPMRSYTMDLGESAHPHAPVAASTTASPAGEPAPAASAPAPAPAQRNAATVAPIAPVGKAAVAQAATEPATQAPAPAVGAKSTWTVQLGTFSSRPNAARLVGALKSRGFSALIVETTGNSGRKLFRVRVGAEKDRAAAQKLLVRLKAAGEKGGQIISR
jgi:DedD protein